jgi:hypothetical protein
VVVQGVVFGWLPVVMHIGPLAPVQFIIPIVHTLPVMQFAFCVHAAHVPLSQKPLAPEPVVQGIVFGWLPVVMHVGPLAPVQFIIPIVHTLPVMQFAFCVHAPHVPLSQ